MYSTSFRTKKNGVPYLEKEEMDVIAEGYIRDYRPEALERPMEIDIDDFACNYLRLKQDFQYLSHNGVYLGMMVFNDTNRVAVYVPETNTAEYISAKEGTIIIDNQLLKADQEHRYRFTMGHEVAHSIYHKQHFYCNPNQLNFFEPQKDPTIQCRTAVINGYRKPKHQWDDKDSMEWQANYMSAAILMPRKTMIMLVNSLKPLKEELRQSMYISEVSKSFNVSYSAAENRLIELRLM